MRRQLMWTLVLRGSAALLFGIAALVWPGVTVLALALLFGAYALVDGLALLTSAFRKEGDNGHRLAHAVGGFLGIAAGVITIAWPGVTALALVTLVGAWAVITGIVEVWAAVRFRRELHHEWLLFLAGAASVIAGVLIWTRPDVGAITVAQVIGLYALISGALVLGTAWRLNGTIAAHSAHHARHA
ncbi:HdeD family acid-resistance protein [Streptomyces sp. 5-8]|uniref:HdeD family acid-resistance protein n=1 Tax=Streptomyces musisoli TaxID=2802280 RepID=A0ABS1NUQ0_9ACTN|nr:MULTISPECIES: HdeD family acid-resistance protein [Streptomyces]MBL1103481.1 HdeD family acid-resistance protein [Streptomyces musisoli]MBY8839913.1 HdeD family acid-resistance protein [Streptomyces sp. SP2-10]